MRYQLLGASGLRVSELCLGTMTFGSDGWGTPEDEAGRIYSTFRDAVVHGAERCGGANVDSVVLRSSDAGLIIEPGCLR